ncbi:hypothetical protein DM450_23675 (plasmid) [Sphingomonas sp. IC081]|nr:hypothetical protein DM450_23675 [Sphingomonas sp. IC081]
MRPECFQTVSIDGSEVKEAADSADKLDIKDMGVWGSVLAACPGDAVHCEASYRLEPGVGERRQGIGFEDKAHQRREAASRFGWTDSPSVHSVHDAKEGRAFFKRGQVDRKTSARTIPGP